MNTTHPFRTSKWLDTSFHGNTILRAELKIALVEYTTGNQANSSSALSGVGHPTAKAESGIEEADVRVFGFAEDNGIMSGVRMFR